MACKHKFYDYLHFNGLDFEPETLVIGTFNPEWPEGNQAEWFYGRTKRNYFWDVLPRMFNEPSLRQAGPKEWKNFCQQKKVVITDLIASINDAEEKNPVHFEVISKFKDLEFAKTFDEFKKTGVLDLLLNYTNIKAVYYTRQPGVELFDAEINKVMEHCKQNGIYFSHLLTPSASARYQMGGWKPKDPNLKRSLANFIYERWWENWGQNINH